MSLALLGTLAWLGMVVALMVYVDRDLRRDAPARRYSISFRSNALARPSRRWRWTLHPAGRPTRSTSSSTVTSPAQYCTHGWARTYAGASWAAHRARGRLETACAEHRRELEEYLATFDTREAS